MERTAENKMGRLPVPGLIIKMSLPMMVSMLVLAAYNVVDSIYVSRISGDALAAVSLVFPLQMLINAVGVGTAIGANSLVARRLGEKRLEDADTAAANSLFLSIAGGLFFAAFFGLLTPALVRIFSPEAKIYRLAVTYLTIVGALCIFSQMQVMIEKLLQAAGGAVQSMTVQLCGAVLNIIFDPILIFGLYGFPRLGVAGAALATVGGQFFGLLLGIFFISRRGCPVRIRLKGFRPSAGAIADIYQVGGPNVFMHLLGSVMNGGLNKILIGFSPAAVSVMGVYFKLQSFVFMPVFGLNSGAMPIMAYNYGARDPRRVMQALRYGTLYALCIMSAGCALFQLKAPWMLSLFRARPGSELMELGVPALRAISISFPVAALCIMGSSLFQAMGKGRLSFLVSAMRQLLILLPAAFAFSRLFDLGAVWFAFPLAELVTAAVEAPLVLRIYRSELRPMSGASGEAPA